MGRQRIFSKPEDYAAFERVIEETLECRPMRICGYCLMPNHWHFVLWPESERGVFSTTTCASTSWSLGFPQLCIEISRAVKNAHHFDRILVLNVEDDVILEGGHASKPQIGKFRMI